MEEPFVCAATQKPPSRSLDDVLHAGDAGDLIHFPVVKAVKPAAALLGGPTDPECALPVLINRSHGRRFHIEMAQHARSPAIQPAVSAEPQVAIGCLGNGENVATPGTR